MLCAVQHFWNSFDLFAYTFPTSINLFTFTHRVPPTPHTMSNLLNIFDNTIWFCLTLCIAGLSLTFGLLEYFQTKKDKVSKPHHIL